jgi:hypothetical protein
MEFTAKGHTTIIRDSKDDLGELISKLTHEINTFKGQNLIIDLTHYGPIEKKHLLFFKPLSKDHERNKKSFVVVVSATDFNAFTDDLIVVPTLLEAHDMIEMEEIERDLGF